MRRMKTSQASIWGARMYFVGLMRLGDVARTAHHGRHAQHLAEDAGLGAIDHAARRYWIPTSFAPAPWPRRCRSDEKAGVEERSTVPIAAAGCLAFILGSSSFSSHSKARLPSASIGSVGSSR